MLLSLDQFSMDQFQFGATKSTSYDDQNTFPSFGHEDLSRSMTFNSRSGRNNGHGYSYSSDLEGADDSSRISSQQSRGRRSNSSSGFQSSLGRINSMRESTHQRSIPGTPKPLHSRGGKGSKSSSSNSVDAGYAQVLGSQRWAQGFGGASNLDRSPAKPPAPNNQQSPWHIEFSNSFLNEEYDAAPTPTIPGGPRRLTTVPSLPVLHPPPEPPKSPGPDRKRSTRSSRSATVGRKPEPKTIGGRDMPPLPSFDLDSAPAPHVGYEKSKEPPPATPNGSSQQLKEKPSFFRRMFGSSKTNLASPLPQSNSTPYVASSSTESPGSKSQHHIATQIKSPSAPPSRDSHHAAPHVLQKKTSSFFRRRKHSVTEDEPPLPPPPVVLPPVTLPIPSAEMLSPKPDPSPITSLRRAMDPFLKGSPTASVALTPDVTPPPEEYTPPQAASPRLSRHEDDLGRNTRGFSPDYEPSPKALIRTVDPDETVKITAGQTRVDTPTRQPPEPPSMASNGSFFNDNSDSEPSPQRRRDYRAESDIQGLRPAGHLEKRTSSTSMRESRVSDIEPEVKTPIVDTAAQQSPKSANMGLRPRTSTLALPIEGIMADGSRTRPSSAKSVTPELSPQTAGETKSPGELKSSKSIDEPDFVVGDPTEDDRQKAQRIYDGSEDFIQKEKAAAWMGEEGPVRQRTLRAYMNLYDFQNKSIVESLRLVCSRLMLKAETQQVDRILVAFARQWCECNPNHGFKAVGKLMHCVTSRRVGSSLTRSLDVIHTICYSIMLLNTDLHMADIEHKMTRSQFVKNTITSIRQSLEDAAPNANDRPSILPGKTHNLAVDGDIRPSADQDRRNSFRSSFKPPPRPDSSLGDASSQVTGGACRLLVSAPFEGPLRGWESQVEIVLKDIFVSIRDERLPLFGSEQGQLPTPGGLSVASLLKRTPSVLSKAPSEGVSSTRGRISESARASTSRFSKSRSRHRPFGGTGFSSSRTSFDDNNSIWSPTESSATWSRASLGRTHTSMSMDSFGSGHPRGDYQQSVGFANALSQAIIREDNTIHSPSVMSDDFKTVPLLEDESLELAGPPWVKEGLVIHKHHLDGIDKKAKDRNWSEVFAVIQKGQMGLFSFTPNKSLRNKSRSRLHGGSLPKGAVVGGGNWQENATNLGTISLRQALASALPPPGYSRQRPNVWALSLPTGAVHLFQVGTPEISKEFVNTANYWSARLSTHPLVGGISNVEYGWSEAIVNNALVAAINESSGNLSGRPGTGKSSTKGHSRPGSATNAASVGMAIRTSLQSRGSIRSGSLDFPRPGSGSSGALGSAGTPGSGSRHAKLPGDRVHIAEWSPPTQSMRPSNLGEPEQLETLMNYVKGIEDELQAHNSMRSPMLLAFTPRGANHGKAMANWQRKSEYLLREIVKFRTYVDALRAADAHKAEIYHERDTARRAARGEEVGTLGGTDDDHSANGEPDDGADGDETLRP